MMSESPRQNLVLLVPDVLFTLATILQDARQHETLSSLALVSRSHHVILQPFLLRIKKERVLNVDDFRWRNRGNDENVETILCNHNTPLPFPGFLQPPELQPELEYLHDRLKPRTILFRGQPLPNILQAWLDIFPTFNTVHISDDIWLHQTDRNHLRVGLSSMYGKFEWKALMDNCNALFEWLCLTLETTLTLRHVVHDSHRRFLTDDPGQQHYFIRAVQNSGDVLERRIHAVNQSLGGVVNDVHLSSAVACTLPTNKTYQRIQIDCYRQLPTAPGFRCFYDPSTLAFPPGYQALSDMTESIARRHLAPDGTLSYRLFILNHGGIVRNRAEMRPVWRTTCGVSEGGVNAGKVSVRERFVDEGFVRCVVDGGCERCSGGIWIRCWRRRIRG